MIEFHFKKALAYLGFGDCEKVYWSLGVSFHKERDKGGGEFSV